MTIIRRKVRLPRAPKVEIMILKSTFIVVHDWASFNTRICNKENKSKHCIHRGNLQGTKPLFFYFMILAIHRIESSEMSYMKAKAILVLHSKHGSATMRVFSVSRHFFKTNVTESVAELILYSQKTQNCGHFLSNLMN